ncbi:uncharacterized protein B0I36DRAFT_401682 [Microdochium trichocladiopsis]|uniref:Uncharacterized protein n=1 Tax=Microdochium trichocladiopsis TaxID=1682393 RepID=A0A9P8XR62_9PEZI|nr:uncharacterized protein B0I36DRAFT_401682 [Microdochium trichocladiopsis]KAH7009365.1 hypothetical protein B0I36DRAFT_401682 [Microdochium trichocladiopsis]
MSHIWKLQLRRGRITTLTQDTIEDVNVAPGTYWNDNLMAELSIPVNENVPEPQFQPDETTITLTNSKRGVPAYTRRFPKLGIDWEGVENKLRSWKDFEGTSKLLDSDVMDRLVDHAEKGRPLETHADVPQGIRKLIKTRKVEEDARKKRKRHGPDMQSINVRLFCHEHSCNQHLAAVSSDQGQPALALDFAEPDDTAPIVYAHWLSARVSNQHWQAATKLAGEVTVAKGYDLKWLHANQKEGQKMLVANGVLEGVAARL